MSNNAMSKYLLYQVWETNGASGSISGSYLYDLLIRNEDEAKIELVKAKRKHEEFSRRFPTLYTNRNSQRFVYIKNETYWWRDLNIT